MKIEELIYKTPEMSEERLIELLDKYSPLLKREIRFRLNQLHKEKDLSKALLTEYDLIQDKKSNLSKSQRDQVIGFVGMCMIQMTKGEDEK
jgi:hypothetical protein